MRATNLASVLEYIRSQKKESFIFSLTNYRNTIISGNKKIIERGRIMKKIYLVVALLAVVLMSSSAMAVSADKELCLFTSSSDGTASTQRTIHLSYTGLIAGHVSFYGESCYIISAVGEAPEVRDCMPMFGSGILNENQLEIGLQGVEVIIDYGARVLLSGAIHILLSIDTLDGTYAGESVYYIGGERQEVFESGPMTAVKCPAVTKSEIDADKQFKKLIDQLDKLGNVE